MSKKRKDIKIRFHSDVESYGMAELSFVDFGT